MTFPNPKPSGLAAEGYAPRNQVLQLEQSQAELRSVMADLKSNRMRAQQAIAEQRQRMTQRRQEYHKEAGAQLADVRREVQAGQEKLKAITEELCGASFSKSTVSALCAGLDARVRAFNERRLDGNYPFLLVDALFFKSRDDDRVVGRAALTVSGITEDGKREILGIRIGDTESFSTWDETFRWLKSRGLGGVMFVISDSHGGLTQAITKHFQGASWQRCQVHLMRNLLSFSPVKLRGEVAAHAKLVLHAHDMVEANRQLDVFIEKFGKSAPKAVACLEEGFTDAMAVMALPEKYRRRLRTTNMQERLNEEIRRRERVIRIFPNDEAALRLMGALLAEFNETWAERLYINMDEFKEWLMKRSESDAVSNVVAMAL